jgi:hypothetical protein
VPVSIGLMSENTLVQHIRFPFPLRLQGVAVETAFPNDSKRIGWISVSIAGLKGFGVKEAIDGIRAQGITTPEDIGTHLFKSGRCAMAHAARKPIIDPDKPGELR